MMQTDSQRVAEDYIASMNEEFTITGETPLYDGSDEIKGYLFHLTGENRESGYVIVFSYDGTLRVTESSFETDIDVARDDIVYYNGLLEYYVEDNGVLRNYSSGEMMNREDLREFADYDPTVTAMSRPAEGIMSITPNYLYSLSSSVTPINQHSASSSGDYKCMQASAAMLVQYYKEHKSGYSGIASVTGGSLIDALTNYIPLSGNYTTLSSLKSGLSSYITDKGFTNSVVSNQCDLYNDTLPADFYETMATELTNDKPMIIIVGSEIEFTSGTSPLGYGSASMHAMVVRNLISISSNVYIGVVDPWDATNKQILWDPYNSESREYFAVYSVVRVTIS